MPMKMTKEGQDKVGATAEAFGITESMEAQDIIDEMMADDRVKPTDRPRKERLEMRTPNGVREKLDAAREALEALAPAELSEVYAIAHENAPDTGTKLSEVRAKYEAERLKHQTRVECFAWTLKLQGWKE